MIGWKQPTASRARSRIVALSWAIASTTSLSVPAIAQRLPQPTPLDPQILKAQQPTQTLPIQDLTIVPGERIGPITGKTTYPDLVRIFGQQRLSDVRPPDADATEREHGTRIDLGPDYSLTLVWLDETKTGLYEAIDLGPGWEVPGGLKDGMTWAELKQKFGGPFNIVGLEGPYSGVVLLNSTPMKQHFGKMILQIQAAPDAKQKFPNEYQSLVGERIIPSTDPNWDKLGMTVKHVIVLFPRR